MMLICIMDQEPKQCNKGSSWPLQYLDSAWSCHFFLFTHISFNGGFVSHCEEKIVIGNPDTFLSFVIQRMIIKYNGRTPNVPFVSHTNTQTKPLVGRTIRKNHSDWGGHILGEKISAEQIKKKSTIFFFPGWYSSQSRCYLLASKHNLHSYVYIPILVNSGLN